MTKNDQSSISISFNSGRQSWVKVDGTPLPITNTNIDLPILTEAPVTSVNGQTGDVVVSEGGGESVDLTLVAVATIAHSGYNTEAVSSFTSFSLTTEKTFDALLAKARTKILSCDGSLSWTDESTMIEMRPVEIWKQEIAPAALLAYYGITSSKDGILVYFDSFNYRSEATSDETEVYRRIGAYGAMRLIYEDANGDMQIVDPSQES